MYGRRQYRPSTFNCTYDNNDTLQPTVTEFDIVDCVWKSPTVSKLMVISILGSARRMDEILLVSFVFSS
jgi:hypothetical protein